MSAGIQQIPLKQIIDDRGKVMHMLRKDAAHFQQFGEIYFSYINPGFVKAWKRHKETTINITVPVGSIKVVTYDNRQYSDSRGKIGEYICGENDYNLLIIPAGIWYGFQCLSSSPAMIANCTTMPHSPDETVSLPDNDEQIPYKWT